MLAEFDRICATDSSGINPSYMAQATPIGSGGKRGAITSFARGQYVGPADELQDLLAPMLKAATPTKSAFEERSFWDVQSATCGRRRTRPRTPSATSPATPRIRCPTMPLPR